jgi:NADPH:quinone reductase-like Zn-dependent oxidoreductase
VNYNNEDYLKTIEAHLGKQQLSASFNAVGGKSAKTDLKLLGPGGRLFLFGGADLATRKGLFGKLSFLWKMGIVLPIGLMMQSKNILGVNMLKIAETQPQLIQNSMAEMLRMYQIGQLKLPNVASYHFSDFTKAHDVLGQGQTTGKVVVSWV